MSRPNETLARFGSPYDRQYIAHQKWLDQREEQRKQLKLIEKEKES